MKEIVKHQWLDPTIMNGDGSKYVIYLTSELKEDLTPYPAKIGIQQSYKSGTQTVKQTVRLHPTLAPILKLVSEKCMEMNEKINLGTIGPIGGPFKKPEAIT